MAIGGLHCLSCSEEPTKTTSGLFQKIAPEQSGVDFINEIPESPQMNSFIYEYYYNGGGVAVGDVNNDNLLDIYFTGNLLSNELYLNQGDFKFKKVTIESKSGGVLAWTTGVNMVDINNDGWLDIYICKSGPFNNPEMRKNELLINQGLNSNGVPTFVNKAEEFGLDNDQFSSQSAFFDFDLDGDLDMFLLNHIPGKIDTATLNQGRFQYSDLGDQMYENVNGKYQKISKQSGILSNGISYGLGVGVSDLNGDGWPDIYVSNDYEEHDYCYINKGNGKFVEVIKTATNQISNFSMGNDIADYDNDLLQDVVVLDMASSDNYGVKTSMPSMNPKKFKEQIDNDRHYQYMFNSLLRNTFTDRENGHPFFSNYGQMAGITNTDWSWGPLFVDFDNDGKKDLFISNGIKRDFRNNDFLNHFNGLLRNNKAYFNDPSNVAKLIHEIPQKAKKNFFYKNIGQHNFEDQTDNWLEGEDPTFSNGAVYADLDNDGDYDLIVNNIDQKAHILKNQQKNHSVTFTFKGGTKNQQGIGAKIIVYSGALHQTYENYLSRGYLSSVAPSITVGVGQATTIDSVYVEWPGALAQWLYNLPSGKNVQLDILQAKKEKAIRPILKKNRMRTLEIKHEENEFDDFSKQILLPHQLSQEGPALAVVDLNEDGLDDFFIGQSAGTASSLYLQQQNGSFQLLSEFSAEKEYEDVGAIFIDYDLDGDQDLFVVSGGNEFKGGSDMYQDRLYKNTNNNFKLDPGAIPDYSISGSTVVSDDVNQDGLPDLIVTGMHQPGNYPVASSSKILINLKGRFEDQTEAICAPCMNLGMVRDVDLADLNGDGQKDLIFVGEWMEPTLLLNHNGTFNRTDTEFPKGLTGWYFAVKTADIDNDGDLDILLGNLGLNYKYKASPETPFNIFYGDFDASGSNDIILGQYESGELFPVRGKQCSSQQMPSLKKEIVSYHDFGSKTLKEIYPESLLSKGQQLQASNFSSGVLRNDGQGNFNFTAFPRAAQVSSINDFETMDINGDGFLDLVFAGNLFGSEIETPRNDASCGLVLLNRNGEYFEAVPSNESGLFIPKQVSSIQQFKSSDRNTLIIGVQNGSIQMFIVP